MQLDLEKFGSKYVMLQKKYKASIITNESLLNEISCLKENNHNVVKFDIPCEKHVNDCDEKTALLDKIKFLEQKIS